MNVSGNQNLRQSNFSKAFIILSILQITVTNEGHV